MVYRCERDVGSNVVIMNVIILIVIGVIIADLLQPSNIQGTTTLLRTTSQFWTTGVNGMLGKPAPKTVTA